MPLSGKTVVLGVTGGIAAYKAAEIVSRLRKLHARVFVIMTEHATHFVAPLTFETMSANPVVTDTFARPLTWEVEHVALAKRADLFLIAPATANILAKMAHGIADDMLSTTVLATRAPVLVAPAMNTGMWDNTATQENLDILRRRGVMFVGPDAGFLACGDSGAGRMSEPVEIVEAVQKILCAKRDFDDVPLLVTAGPTRERLDPVRYMTNDSSGKMGYAIAAAAVRRGAKVTLVSGPVSLPPVEGVRMVPVESTLDLYNALMTEVSAQQVVIQAAAPADYRFETTYDQKLKKTGDNERLTFTMVENPDIAAAVGAKKMPGQVLVGFAAETQSVLENAKKKLAKKNLDMIVANDVTAPGAGFGVDTNIVTLVTVDGETSLPLMSKADVADAILDKIAELRGLNR